MEWVTGAITGGLALVLVWGLLHPRSLWRAVAGWAVADVHRHEPGGGSYLVRRLLCLLGLLALGGVWAAGNIAQWTSTPVALPAPSAIAQMWGDPAPRIIDRHVTKRNQAPAGLVEVPVVGYQVIERAGGPPNYLLELQRYDRLGNTLPEGLIGTAPGEGFTAWGSADLLLQVRLPLLCVPQSAVVIEVAASVQVAVYAGHPDAADESERAALCQTGASVTESVLIPIRLEEPLGWRAMTDLDGGDIPAVSLIR